MTMTDLRSRFDATDQIPAPELWEAIQTRASAATARTGYGHGSRWIDPQARRRTVIRTVLTIAAALLLSALSIGLLVRAFRSSPVPVHSPHPTQTPQPLLKGDEILLRLNQGVVAFDPASGRSRVLAAAGPAEIMSAQLSPDGTRLWCFYPRRPEGLTLVGADGLPHGLGVTWVGLHSWRTLAQWSPDGTRILAVGPGAGDLETLYVIDVNTDARTVIPDPIAEQGLDDAMWSPDGSRIAIAHQGVIHIVTPGRPGTVVLHGSQPAWQPFGDRIAFMTSQGIVVANKDGSGSIVVGDGNDQFAWSPDGSRIAFERSMLSSPHLLWRDVWVAPADGSTGPKEIYRFDPREHMDFLEWTTDGTRVALLLPSKVKSLSDEAWRVVNADGSSLGSPLERLEHATVLDGIRWSTCNCASPPGTMLTTGHYLAP